MNAQTFFDNVTNITNRIAATFVDPVGIAHKIPKEVDESDLGILCSRSSWTFEIMRTEREDSFLTLFPFGKPR